MLMRQWCHGGNNARSVLIGDAPLTTYILRENAVVQKYSGIGGNVLNISTAMVQNPV